MYCSLICLTLHIRAGINISHLSIHRLEAHRRFHISYCFVLCVFFLTVCRAVLAFFKCVINLTSFLFKSRFISVLLFIHLFFTFSLFFFLWLSNFSHMKRLRLADYFVCLFCFLSWNCRVLIHNFITFPLFPKDLHCSSFISILTWFYILFWNLYCFLPLDLLVVSFKTYQCAECLRTTLAGFFIGGVHWQWPWTLLRIDPRELGDVLHSVMFPFLYLFLFLCDILT